MSIFTFNEASSPTTFRLFAAAILQSNADEFFFHSPICRLEELRIDDNLLTCLPNTLKLLRNLKSISVSNNRISKLPDFMIAMRFNNGVVRWDYKFHNFMQLQLTLSGLHDSESARCRKEWIED